MRRIYVDRTLWLRGEGSAKSFLLRASDGKMCCLGQCALRLGATRDQIMDQKIPFTVFNELERDGIAVMNDVKRDSFYLAMGYNDTVYSPPVDDQWRERNIIVEMETVGLEFVFGDGSDPEGTVAE